MDERIKKFARLLVGYSTEVRKGEIVIIQLTDDVPDSMTTALIDCIYDAGGHPIVWLQKTAVFRKILWNASKETIELYAKSQLDMMKKAAAYIGISGYLNVNETSDIPREKMALYKEHWFEPVHLKERVKNTKWVIARWPTPGMAQKAGISTEAFEDFYFRVCADVDYEKMSRGMDPLVELMNKTDKVRIIGPDDTDLKFSIKNIPAIKCCGKRNVPDGEVFTAPVRESVNGIIQYNTSTLYEGKSFDGVHLVFKDGKITDASCKGRDQGSLISIFDTDEGSRYVGEFSLGLNPEIKKSMGDILFDEKISKSFHFTPGMAYDEAWNGNKSKVHWDLVCIQSEESGGGKIYFDDILIRDNGVFVLKELESLNP